MPPLSPLLSYQFRTELHPILETALFNQFYTLYSSLYLARCNKNHLPSILFALIAMTTEFE